MSQNIENIKIRPMRVYIGSNDKQKEVITCRADVSGDLFGKYFVIHTPAGENYAVYLDDETVVVPGSYLKPTLPTTGWTDVRVAIASGESATGVASAIKTALEAISGSKFTCVASGKTVTVTHSAAGYAHPCRDAVISAKKTQFAFKAVKLGMVETSIGAIEGDIEISGMEQTVKEIMTHATGETAQAEITTGYSKPEMKFNQFEFDKVAIKRALILSGGQTMLPEIEDAQEVVGYGTTGMAGQKPQYKMRLHPVDMDANDNSEDWTIWKAAFNLESFTFSGTEFSTIPLTASMYPDATKPKMIEFFAIGSTDWMTSI